MQRATPRYQRVMVPLDGSAVAESIIPFIADIAGPLDMEMVLLRVVTPVAVEAEAPVPGVIQEELTARMTKARDYLARVAPTCGNGGFGCRDAYGPVRLYKRYSGDTGVRGEPDCDDHPRPQRAQPITA